VRLALPYSHHLRYLTGIDWLVGMLDHMTFEACGVGNRSQLVVEIEGGLPQETLRASLARFLEQLPFQNGAPARDWNLAPYWRPRTQSDCSPRLRVTRLPADAGLASVLRALAVGLQDETGRPASSDARGRYLSFSWLTAGEHRAYLAMAFDHRLLDAPGRPGRPGTPRSRSLARTAPRRQAGRRPPARAERGDRRVPAAP
jgi:hypothetical protein